MDKICPDCFSVSLKNGICEVCGYCWEEQFSIPKCLKPYTVLTGQYLIGKVVGRGGFGITYKAYDLETQSICAIKEYMPGFLDLERINGTELQIKNSSDKERYEHGKKRFIEEAEILYRIQGYPYITKMRNCFPENNTYYYVMNYVEGINLKQLVTAERYRFSVKEATEVILKIGNTLQAIYDREGLIHRDISPENILVDKTGEYTLIDFGSAKEVKPGGNEGLSVVLKPGFAPLEQFSETMPQGSYTDVYALAGTYYFMITGNMLPTAVERLNNNSCYTPLYYTGKGIPSAVSEAVDRALKIEFKQRTQSIRIFLNELLDAGAMGSSISIQKEKENRQELKWEQSDVYGYIEIISGQNKGKIWKIYDDKKVWNVGRDSNRCHIVIAYNEVSRKHFEITFDSKAELFVGRDCSTNGILVDSKFYIMSDFQVNPGCIIQFPKTDCVLYLGVRNEKK